jgi:two-component system chemotaxis sensor kinase CheA
LHKGSKFRIQLPLTLAIIDATTVKLNDQRFAIPMAQIHESVQVKELDIHSSVNIGEIINLRGENLKVFRLNSLLGIKDQGAAHPRILLVSRIDEEAFGILVHDISSMQQIVVKKLGAELVKMVGVTGSAILGDGKPALILDLPRLIARPITGSTLKSVLPPTRMAT